MEGQKAIWDMAVGRQEEGQGDEQISGLGVWLDGGANTEVGTREEE